MLKITAIPALKDNYIWMITHPTSESAIIVDPGEAKPVISVLQQKKLNLLAILVTHHHWDHTNGISELCRYQPAPVYAAKNSPLNICDYRVADQDELSWKELDCRFKVLTIPGHTLDHVAYFGQQAVFCGDTLFTGGCGRLFEGSAEQLYQSLNKLAALPEPTQVYCGHEYTENNLRFALQVEPNNQQLLARIANTGKLRQQQLPTVPSTMGLEKATNPFLRCETPEIRQNIIEYFNLNAENPTTIFSFLRLWKDNF